MDRRANSLVVVIRRSEPLIEDEKILLKVRSH